MGMCHCFSLNGVKNYHYYYFISYFDDYLLFTLIKITLFPIYFIYGNRGSSKKTSEVNY